MSDEHAGRFKDLLALQDHYKDFRDFYWDVSTDLIGAKPTEQQLDIAEYIAYGPQYLMAQAQRGEAKTTIAGCFAVFSLIHNPALRVLIISAGTPMAKQISTWCIQIIYHMDILEPLRPDKNNPGTRTSVEAFDIHHALKGPDKSPSIACLGITSNMQGYRADLLIPDDIESSKNSQTAPMRDHLRQLTRDFTSICQSGRIAYLGTPQSVDSIYNDLPARGFDVRIWPGRYPTEDEELNYGPHLAPMIKQRMLEDTSLRLGGGLGGERGKPTDPLMMPEDILTKKELDQGKSYFNLQFMLDTALSDADRHPLKLHDLLFYPLDKEDSPKKFVWSNDIQHALPHTVGSPIRDRIYRPARVSEEFLPYSHKLLSIDPAGGGQNGDETGVAVLYACNGYILVMHVTGIPGGTQPEKLQQIVKLAKLWDTYDVLVEKNFGNGAYAVSLEAAFREADARCSIQEVWSTGQKELRIIDALEPVIGSHRLVINASVPDHDVSSTQKYAKEKQSVYQFLFQLRHITREKGSLIHEDRLEAVSQGVAHLVKVLTDQDRKGQITKPIDSFKGFKRQADGIWRFAHRVATPEATALPTILDRFRR